MFLTNPWLFFKNVRLRADPAALTVTPRLARLTRQLRMQAAAPSIEAAPGVVAMERTRVILAQAAAVSLAGEANLNRNLLLQGEPAALSLTTAEAVMQRTRVAGFIKTEVTIAPQPAQFTRGLRLEALSAEVSLAPQSANFLKVAGSVGAITQAIAIEPGAAGLRASRLLLPAVSEIIVDPGPSLLLRRYPLLASPAILTLTPNEALLLLQRRLAAVKTEVAIAGQAAALTYTPALAFVQATPYVGGTSKATHDVTLPGGSGGKLLVLVAQGVGNNGITTPSGWNLLFDVRSGSTTSDRRLWGFTKDADGSEGSTLAITQGSSGTMCGNAYRVSGAIGAFTAATDQGSSTGGNPPNLAYGSAALTLIIAAVSKRGAAGVSGAPSGYSDFLTAQSSGLTCAVADKMASLTSEDPGSFTATDNDKWAAATVGIR